MTSRLRNFLLAGTGAATLAATAMPGAAIAQDQPLVIARNLEINSLDPHRAFCDTCQIYLSSTYQGLVKLAADDRSVEPLLATEWTTNEDQTQFTFTLDPDAVFSDGSPVEAKDVKWTFERLKNIQADPSFMMNGLASIETPDDKTVVVNMENPNSEFIGILAAPYVGIINSDVAMENGATAGEDASSADQAETWFLANSAGSGPYVLDTYRPDDELRFRVNENYWGDAPPITDIVIDQVADAVSQAQMLQSGGADIAMQVDPDTASTINSPDITIETVPSYNFIYVMFSPGAQGGEMLDLEVRQALAYAIDYQGAIDFTVGGEGELQAAPIPNGFPGTEGLPMPEENLEKARELLASKGLEDGFTLDITVAQLNVYGVDLTLLMQKLQQDLARINVTINIQPVASAVWREQIANPGIPFSARFYAPDYFGSAQYVQFFGMLADTYWERNASGQGKVDLVNDRETELFQQALAASGDKMNELYHEIAMEMIKDRIIVPVVSPNLILAYRNEIEGVRYSACCNLPLAELSRK
ncbi:ABC transporter substrate-binding protein [Mesorhizobium sp. CAU 1741]|uniref:ABC transporter substrate-binding protein n=1 Tax=Mesorhizobium sp. CAU 1741 TaxID=3140366 RepID=UPI00325B57C1